MSASADVIIIGGGAAGLTAALFVARRGLRTVVVTEDIGGQASTTGLIENYPGVDPTDGFQLMLRFKAQAESAGASILLSRATSIIKTDDGFIVRTAHGDQAAPAVIVASGLTHRKLGIPGEEALSGRGVSYCAACDAPLFRNVPVAVIGGGNSAMDSALMLAAVASRVTLVTVNPELRGEQVLIDRIAKTKNIVVMTAATTTEITGSQHVTGLVATHDGQSVQLDVSGVFVEVGFVVNPDLVTGLIEVDARNQIIIQPASNATSVPGLFAAGDITTITQKQVVISAGEGAKAGLAVVQYLAGLRGELVENIDWTHIEPLRHQSTARIDLPTSQHS